MSKKVKAALVATIAVVFGGLMAGQAFAQVGDLPGMGGADRSTGGLIAPALGHLGNTERGPCVQQLLNMPALNSCRDAAGRVIMDLPALTLIGPAGQARAPRRLPVTGVNTGDIAAIGAAALAAGFVLLRRVRLSLAS
jgi:LPXTG-motif cell wall-anchored protein